MDLRWIIVVSKSARCHSTIIWFPRAYGIILEDGHLLDFILRVNSTYHFFMYSVYRTKLLGRPRNLIVKGICFHCQLDIEISGNTESNPWIIHAEKSPACPYLIKSKGIRFINDVWLINGKRDVMQFGIEGMDFFATTVWSRWLLNFSQVWTNWKLGQKMTGILNRFRKLFREELDSTITSSCARFWTTISKTKIKTFLC